MTRTITAAALFAGLLAMPLSAGLAQTMSTPVDRVLRPGDTIQWVPVDSHHLQVGRAGLPLGEPAPATMLEPSTELVGKVLFSEYMLPFEIASILLLVAMIGAVVMAKKKI